MFKLFSRFMLTFFSMSILLLSFSVQAQQKNESQPTISFGIVPQQSARVLAKKWIPIFNYLEKKTGYKIVFKTTKTIPEFEKNVMSKSYDFAYMNPYHYTVFHEKPGYRALLKQGSKQIIGIVVVQKDSPIQSLEDLKGKKIAFPAPAAFAATVIPQSVMKQKNLDFFPFYTSSHESVYKNVSYGNFVAGGGIERTFANTPKAITDNLRVLWRSKGYTPHAIAAAPHVNEDISRAITKAFLSMNKDAEGRKLLQALKFKYIEKAHNDDWDDVRDLDIKLLENLQKVSG